MAAEHADIVPFGKYKGRPVVDLISDRSYTDWLAAQPWFRERYGNVYNLVLNTGSAPQDSPEHNALQARFLDHDEALRLCRPWLRDHAELVADWLEEYGSGLTARQRGNLIAPDFHTSRIRGLLFESGGWDLVVRAETVTNAGEIDSDPACICACDWERCGSPYRRTADDAPVHDWSDHYDGYRKARTRHCAPDCPSTWADDFRYITIVRGLRSRIDLAVELKPTLGDDYPTVLREVLKRRELDRARGGSLDACLVLADEVTFSSVSYEKVQKIFRSQAVRLMTTAELLELAPVWQCTCTECAGD